jgi:hypothetical protein
MKLAKHSSRWALWAFAAALLLKSAMPFLASASAHMQGKALAEVCTVYGVVLVSQPDDRDEPPADRSGAHGGDQCALTALTALATAEPSLSTPLSPATGSALDLAAYQPLLAHDAAASWIARLKHGPPGHS